MFLRLKLIFFGTSRQNWSKVEYKIQKIGDQINIQKCSKPKHGQLSFMPSQKVGSQESPVLKEHGTSH